MTPKFKYDPEQDCLREVARMKEPALSEFKTNSYWMAMDVYNLHLASLRVIPCYPGSKWPEGELEEFKAFTVARTSSGKMAFPITPQPRLYTQAEAEDIWRGGYDCGHAEAAREDYIDKQQYFKTRFNVELTPQTP